MHITSTPVETAEQRRAAQTLIIRIALPMSVVGGLLLLLSVYLMPASGH